MPYTHSLAQTGRGTTISIGTVGATPTYSLIGEVKSASQSGSQNKTEEVTNLNSTSEEFLVTIQDPGTFSLSGSRVSNDAGQAAIEAAYSDGILRPFKLQFPPNTLAGQTTTGDLISFNALVVSRNFGIEVSKAITFSTELKISGSPVLTPGS